MPYIIGPRWIRNMCESLKQLFRQPGFLSDLITFTTLFSVFGLALGASLNVFFIFFALTIGYFTTHAFIGRQNLSLI